MKRILTLCLALVLSLGLSVSVFASSLPFADVSKKDWFYEDVKEAYEQKITNGTTPLTFSPNSTVTREMFVTMLIRSAGIDMSLYEDASKRLVGLGGNYLGEYLDFSDVWAGQWYTPYVFFAAEAELMQGMGNGTFGVGKPITREQMATVAARFVQMRYHTRFVLGVSPEFVFTDAEKISPWAQESVETMRAHGILQGDEGGRVNSQSTATRAEAVAVVLRLQKLTERGSFVPAGTASIRLRDATRITDGGPREYVISDPAELQKVIARLDAMPIQTETAVPAHSGWSYAMYFRDADGNTLRYAEFGTDSIGIGITSLGTEKNYLKPIIDMIP